MEYGHKYVLVTYIFVVDSSQINFTILNECLFMLKLRLYAPRTKEN
jgi:hypothetical protein